MSEADERRALTMVKEYAQCLELVKRLLEGGRGGGSKNLQALVSEAKLQLRSKDPPVFASPAQLEAMFKWVAQRRNRIDLPETAQMRLDNRRELLQVLLPLPCTRHVLLRLVTRHVLALPLPP